MHSNTQVKSLVTSLKKKKKKFGDLTHSLISHNFYHKIIIIEWTTFIIKFNLRGLFYNDCSLLP